jgi:hypothetical protein
VTDTAVRPPSVDPARPTVAGSAGAEATLTRWLCRPLVACLVLLAVYATCSLALNDPRGTLGTDTGGKLATLQVMDRTGSLVPEVGYWTTADAKGELHPLFYTFVVDGKFVNVTTLPMVYLAYPLYELGGDFGVLLIPMLGSVLCALAARALARRLGHRTGWTAFWAMGLLSPVAIYALDFWEHSLGLALMLWGVVWLVDLIADRHATRVALLAGCAFGAAATMRTEALVYLVVCTGIACVARLVMTRRLLGVLRSGLLVAVGAVSVLVANELFERLVLGGSIRSSRAAGTAADAGASTSVRVTEAFTTLIGLNRFTRNADFVLGALIVGALALAIWTLVTHRSITLLGGAALVAAAFFWLIAISAGLGFIPGLLTASPVAVVGLALGWRPDLRTVTLMAVVALPVVWAFQYSGGANPQWGGRYTLLSGALLLVTGVVALSGRRQAFVATVVAAAVVTGFGVAWLSVRSHWVTDGMEALISRHDDALISREAHVLREGGAFYDSSRHWLTATDDAEVRRAVQIVDRAGDHEFGYVVANGSTLPRALAAYERVSVETVQFLPGYSLRVGTYRRP